MIEFFVSQLETFTSVTLINFHLNFVCHKIRLFLRLSKSFAEKEFGH